MNALPQRPSRLLAAFLFTVLASTVPAGVVVTQRFSLADDSDQLFTPREVHLQDGTIMQSFAFDNTHQHIYVSQLSTGTATTSGDLTITKLSWDGQTILGHMYLKGFGHGSAIGCEPSGADAYLWTEVDSVSDGDDGWGSRIGRFKFVNGTTLLANAASITKFSPIPGSDKNSCTVDITNARIVVRYRLNSVYKFALFNLSTVKAGGTTSLCNILQPSGLGTLQGYVPYGSFMYMLSGDPYSASNPPPGNAVLTVVNLNTGGVVEQAATNAGTTLTYREPEGIAVRTSGTRLCFGFASQETAGQRLASIWYKNVLVNP